MASKLNIKILLSHIQCNEKEKHGLINYLLLSMVIFGEEVYFQDYSSYSSNIHRLTLAPGSNLDSSI